MKSKEGLIYHCLTACVVDDCHLETVERRCGKKQKSQQSLDSPSKQLNFIESTDIVCSSTAAAAGADVGTNLSVVESKVDASESLHGPVIGLSLCSVS